MRTRGFEGILDKMSRIKGKKMVLGLKWATAQNCVVNKGLGVGARRVRGTARAHGGAWGAQAGAGRTGRWGLWARQ